MNKRVFEQIRELKKLKEHIIKENGPKQCHIISAIDEIIASMHESTGNYTHDILTAYYNFDIAIQRLNSILSSIDAIKH